MASEKSYDDFVSLLREYLPRLGASPLARADALADLGLDSLNTVALVVGMEETFGITFPDEDLTAETFATADSLWTVIAALRDTSDDVSAIPRATATGESLPGAANPAGGGDEDGDIAIIGMAGRFPGADDVERFWENLSSGVQSLTYFSDEELVTAGVGPALIGDANYVKARPTLHDIKGFDAEFFGYSPREAKLADPQQRIFLECAWEALEHAGYPVPERRGRVAVFGGANISTYAFDRFALHPSQMEITPFELIIGNDKDALATIVSYKLDLTGPSMSVQTFCSTSLAAVHLACQSLRRGECEMALAGGVCVRVPDRIGYLYQDGGQESPDAFVRTFDADSQGGVFGDGAAVVLLKPLRQALADRDTVLAVIRGTAMNNDGAAKFSFTAPSVVGQSRAVADALLAARVSPAQISYVEAHGTATELGDPIEVAALTRAFNEVALQSADEQRKQFCAIGSVKTNVGHLDRAAGVTGLIKIVQSLRHELIPQVLHYRQPNPEIDFTNSPFYVAAEPTPWPRTAHQPRIAGLNSLGVGGTNVHAVVQEPPVPASRPPRTRRWQVLPVSARQDAAAQRSLHLLSERLSAEAHLDLADVAFTLQCGRKVFRERRVVVADTAAVAVSRMEGRTGVRSRTDATHGRGVCFLIDGVGEHYTGMVSELYAQEPVFRRHLDECREILGDRYPHDLVGLVTARRADGIAPRDLATLMGRQAAEPPAAELSRTEIAQPAVFVAEYALARTLMDWGVRPTVLLGYSVGEYVAACLAGVMSLPDALALVMHRAELIATLPGGAMLAVALSSDELSSRVPDLDQRGLDVAAVTHGQLVVAGPAQPIQNLAGELRAAGVACRQLETTHAFHSRMLQPVAEQLTDWVAANVTLHGPRLPYVSNVTGDLATAELVTDPSYWARHMCGTVRFAEGLSNVLRTPDLAWVEIGPGQSLGAILRAHPACTRDQWPLIVPTLPGAADDTTDDFTVAEALARLWLTGVSLDWYAYHGIGTDRDGDGWTPGRVPLPTYPFQRQGHWWETTTGTAPDVGADRPQNKAATRLDDLPRLTEERWLYQPVWRETARRPVLATAGALWLVYTDEGAADALASQLYTELGGAGGRVTFVRPGAGLRIDGDTCYIRPGNAEDTLAMLRALRGSGWQPDRVLHLWGVGRGTVELTSRTLHEATLRGPHTLVALARATQEVGLANWCLDVVSTGTHRVIGSEPVHPELATVVGPCRMIPVECPGAKARLIDFPADPAVPVEDLRLELAAEPVERIVAWRAGRRWVPDYDVTPGADLAPPTGVEGAPLRRGGVYLVTGGLGGIGLAMAERLFDEYQARLVLFGRTPVPPKSEWAAVVADDAASAEVRRRLEGLLRLAAKGAEFTYVAGDVADIDDVRRAVDVARTRFGSLNGVLHAAGMPGVGLMQFKTNADMDRVLAPKTAGTLALGTALRDVPIDFLALFSSVASATGALGQVDYCAANVFLDAYALTDPLPGRRVVSIGWGEWTWNGWTAGLAGYEPAIREHLQRHREQFGITFDEGWRVLMRVLRGRDPHLMVSTQDFGALVKRSYDYTMTAVQAAAHRERGADLHPRPDLSTQYTAAHSAEERVIAAIWAGALGLDRVGIHDNFFELGGTSLVGVGIMDSIRRALKLVELPAHVLYQAPTVSALAAAATGSGRSNDSDATSRAARRRHRLQSRRESLHGGRPE